MANVTGTNGRDFVHVSGDGHGVPLHYKDKPLATNLADSIDISQGGTDIVFSGAGKDTIILGAQFTAADQINGEGDEDSVTVDGDYSGGLTFNATTLLSVEKLIMAAGHDYTFTTVDATIANLSYLLFDGTALGASDSFHLDASAETNGFVYAQGGAGDDVVMGGTHSNTYYMSSGGKDTVIGTAAAGDNAFFGAALTAKDRFIGGPGIGFNEVAVEGDYSGGLKLGAHTFADVDEFRFESGFDYKITMNDGNLAAGATMEIDASALLDLDSLVLNGSAESDGAFSMLGGRGNDVFTGGAGNDVLRGYQGGDTLTPGGGADLVRYGIEGVDASTGANYDKVVGFDFAAVDRFDLLSGVTGVDTKIANGTLRGNHVDDDLVAEVTGPKLAANHAVLFTPDAGSLSGHTFLIIDGNAAAGYQAGEDYVIELVSAVHIGSLDSLDFI